MIRFYHWFQGTGLQFETFQICLHCNKWPCPWYPPIYLRCQWSVVKCLAIQAGRGFLWGFPLGLYWSPFRFLPLWDCRRHLYKHRTGDCLSRLSDVFFVLWMSNQSSSLSCCRCSPFWTRPSFFAGVFSEVIVLNDSLSMSLQLLAFEFVHRLQQTFGLLYQGLEGLANRLQVFFEAHRHLRFTRWKFEVFPAGR